MANEYRVTSLFGEALTANTPDARVTQVALESIGTFTSDVRVTLVCLEVLYFSLSSKAVVINDMT